MSGEQTEILTETNPVGHEPAGWGMFGWWEVAACRKTKLPAGFSFYAGEGFPGGVLLTGATSSGVMTRGKRKGTPKWDGPAQKVLVADAERDAEMARYEAETSWCHNCTGSGKTLASCGTNGTTYRPCRRCGGSGKRPEGR